MKKTIVPFLTVAISLSSMSASRANTYELHITKQQVVAGEPNAIYETTIGQTASVTISSRCRYSCKNLDSRERHASMHWQPNVNLISLPPTRIIVGSYGENRYDMYVVIPEGESWVKTDDILTFTVAAPQLAKTRTPNALDFVFNKEAFPCFASSPCRWTSRFWSRGIHSPDSLKALEIRFAKGQDKPLA